jgi:hypothetical protein
MPGKSKYAYRPNIFNIPEEYFKGFNFWHLDNMLSTPETDPFSN